MTDLATALATDPTKLASFEGADVLRTQVAVTNAGDGLSQALGIQPQAIKLGETVYVVLECLVQQIKFVPGVDKQHPEEGLARVHVLRAGRATLIDKTAVGEALDVQAEKIRRAREEAEGIQRLVPATDDWGEDPPEDAEAETPRTRRTRTP